MESGEHINKVKTKPEIIFVGSIVFHLDILIHTSHPSTITNNTHSVDTSQQEIIITHNNQTSPSSLPYLQLKRGTVLWIMWHYCSTVQTNKQNMGKQHGKFKYRDL